MCDIEDAVSWDVFKISNIHLSISCRLKCLLIDLSWTAIIRYQHVAVVDVVAFLSVCVPVECVHRRQTELSVACVRIWRLVDSGGDVLQYIIAQDDYCTPRSWKMFYTLRGNTCGGGAEYHRHR